jgi:hypothetical protein
MNILLGDFSAKVGTEDSQWDWPHFDSRWHSGILDIQSFKAVGNKQTKITQISYGEAQAQEIKWVRR